MPLHCPTDHRPVLEIFTKTVQNFTKIGEIWGKNPIIGVPLVFWVFASRNPKIKPIMWHGWVSRVVGVLGPRGGPRKTLWEDGDKWRFDWRWIEQCPLTSQKEWTWSKGWHGMNMANICGKGWNKVKKWPEMATNALKAWTRVFYGEKTLCGQKNIVLGLKYQLGGQKYILCAKMPQNPRKCPHKRVKYMNDVSNGKDDLKV